MQGTQADVATWPWPQRLLEEQDDRVMLEDFLGTKTGQIRTAFPLHDLKELGPLRLWVRRA